MEFGALNSLAEVGVGLNLAFTLIQPVRKTLQGQLSRVLDEQKSRIGALITDLCAKNGDSIQPKEVEGIDDFKSNVEKFFFHIEVIAVALSVLASFSLIYFLYESSLNPTLEIDDCWAELTLAVVIFPIVFNFVLQLIVWLVAKIYLSMKESKYKTSIEVVDGLIEPTKPTND